jgi:hypothetical protein
VARIYGNTQRGKQRNSPVLVGMRSAPRPRKSLSKFHRDPELRLNALARRPSRPPALTRPSKSREEYPTGDQLHLRSLEQAITLLIKNGEKQRFSPVKFSFETGTRNPAAKPTA